MDKEEKIRLILEKFNLFGTISFRQGVLTVEEGEYAYDFVETELKSVKESLIDLLEDLF